MQTSQLILLISVMAAVTLSSLTVTSLTAIQEAQAQRIADCPNGAPPGSCEKCPRGYYYSSYYHRCVRKR